MGFTEKKLDAKSIKANWAVEHEFLQSVNPFLLNKRDSTRGDLVLPIDVFHGSDSELALELLGFQTLQVMKDKGQRFSLVL